MQREADESLIFQAERVITGANTHRGRNLIHAYRNACYVGNEELINKAKLELAEFIKQWRKYSPVADRREVARACAWLTGDSSLIIHNVAARAGADATASSKNPKARHRLIGKLVAS